MPELKIVADAGVEVPCYAKPGDAGLDLRSTESHAIAPHARVLVGTGIRAAIPEGHVGLLVPRSGVASKRGLTLANSPGIIDSGYRGEIGAPMLNTSDEVQQIEAGERICQLVIVPFATCEVQLVDELDETQRGVGGFGSTGSN